MDNFVPSARPFYDMDRCKINSCGTIQTNRKDMPHDSVPKQLKLKRGDVRVKTRGSMTTLVWKDRPDRLIWTHSQQK
jgi:hypothetical protein